jgi:uncharacterized membrane-anchored protein
VAKRMRTRFLFAAIAALVVGGQFVAASAQDMQAIISSLHPQKGRISIASGAAELNLGPNLVFLNPADAAVVSTKLMGNPPDNAEGIEGAIVPTDGAMWVAMVEYHADGHVAHSDAASINNDELLKQIVARIVSEAAIRRSRGEEGAQIVGWAREPFYDRANKKLYWAKEIKFDSDTARTVNYNMRVLGRAGYISIDVSDDISATPALNIAMPKLLSMVNFTPGNRYGDYVEGTDKAAGFGISNLVTEIMPDAAEDAGSGLSDLWPFLALGAIGIAITAGGFFAKRYLKQKGWIT